MASGHQKSSVHLEKVSMMTRTCETSGKGPMKSMLMVSNGLYVEEAKWWSWMGMRTALIFWQQGQCRMKLRT